MRSEWRAAPSASVGANGGARTVIATQGTHPTVRSQTKPDDRARNSDGRSSGTRTANSRLHAMGSSDGEGTGSRGWWAGLALGTATGTTGLLAGAFYGYASSVMPALARADDRTFIGVMQD